MGNRVLIIDDDDLVCISLRKALIKLGYVVEICMDADEAIDMVEHFEPEIILLDIYLKKQNGIQLLKQIQNKFYEIPVIMITGYADVNIAVSAMKSGAYDFLLKPIDLEQLQLIIKKALENILLKAEVNKLHEIIHEDRVSEEYFGPSKKIQKIVKFSKKLATSSDTTILLEGESGTGKEVLAKYIHQSSPAADKAFIQINCASIPRELAESELFGHEKGAFTGASQKTKLGKFELANNGTILLDEIGELSLDLQAKLLRVLQEKKFYRVGGEKEISVNVRVIAATNKNLEAEMEKGNFREDLYYRLNVAKILIPPIRERKEDIPYLAYSFFNEFSKKFDKKIKRFNQDALNLLSSYPWKGNIRELRNVMERAILLLEDDELKEQHLASILDRNIKEGPGESEFVLKIPKTGVKIDTVLKKLILETLRITDGNQVQAAKVLGLSRSKLRYRMGQLGIEVKKSIPS